jgi:hypothetical protein
MEANTSAAYGIYSDAAALTDIVHNLNQAGFDNEDICMMLSPVHPVSLAVRDASLFNSERESDSATASLIGWLSKFGAVLIPKVGFFVRSQAFLHALMASHGASALCGNCRTLVGLGFSPEDAERCEDQLGDLGVLIYISCTENARTLWAREVLRHTGACEASTLKEPIAAVAAIA